MAWRMELQRDARQHVLVRGVCRSEGGSHDQRGEETFVRMGVEKADQSF